MLADVIRTMYGYGRWANAKLFDAAAGVPVEALRVVEGDSERSMLETMLHAAEAHRGWLSWWDGSSAPADRPRLRYDRAQFRDLVSVREAWDAVDAQTLAFIAILTDKSVLRVYEQTQPDGSRFALPLWQMMLHVVNHGTQHRSEAAAMSTAAGCSPGDLDLVWYVGSREP